MQKWYFYIDWGAGYVLVNPKETQNTNLSWERGELNDFIQRKKLDGSFKLKDAEYTTAKTFFITNGNYEAPLRIYENGDSGSGVLKYEGWAKTNGEWDDRRSLITFDTFKTKDIYNEIVSIFSNKHEGRLLNISSTYSAFGAQGQNSNANKLYNYTWDGTNFTLVAGTPLAIPNLGRVSSAISSGGEIVFSDNVNNTLKTYGITGSQWAEIRNKTTGANVPFNGISVSGFGTNKVALVSDGSASIIEILSYSGASAFTSDSINFTSDLKFPSICWTGNRLAIVDENQKTLRVIFSTGYERYSLSLGDISKPDICTLDATTETIAFIDTKQSKLVTYQFSGGAWTQLGESFSITNLVNPKIHQHGVGSIVLHDDNKGVMSIYSWDGTNWSKTGNSVSISGGYTSTVSSDGTNILLAISDTPVFKCSTMTSYYGVINSILDIEGLYGSLAGDYELLSSGTGANVDEQKVIFGDIKDLADNSLDIGDDNVFKYRLGEVLKYYELFQNYWYIEDVAGAYKIKFTQPALFSSFGSDITISSLQLATELNQEFYKEEFEIDSEEIILNNTNSTEFDGNVVDYNRNTPVVNNVLYDFSTDLDYLSRIFSGQLSREITNSGLVVWYLDDSTGVNLAASGTGVVSSLDNKNNLLSQSKIMEDHWKTYRYGIGDTVNNQITINGSVIAAPSTCRNIIDRPSVQLTYSNIGITEFPDEVANLVWGGSSRDTLIMRFSVNLFTNKITVDNRVHDL